MLIDLPHIKSAIGKLGMVYAVGHIFGLKAEHILLCLRITALEGVRFVIEEVARIELN